MRPIKTLFERMRAAPAPDKPTFELITGDPHFDPNKPVLVNGYLYAPAHIRTG